MTTKKKFKEGDSVLTSIRKWELGKSDKKNTKYVRVTFNHYISWTGWLTPGAMANTMKALETMGFKGSKISDLQYDNALNTEKEFACVIDSSRVWKENTYYDAAWVNAAFETGFDDKSKGMLGEFDMDTRAYIEDAQDMSPPASQDDGIMDQNYDISTDANFTADDIPF